MESELVGDNEVNCLLNSGIVQQMFKLMYISNGVGMAAPQVKQIVYFFLSLYNTY